MAGLEVITEDFAAEQPHIVDVILDGPFRQARPGEVNQEGHEDFDQPPADWKIFFFAHPPLRPLLKIAAIVAVG